MADAQTSLRASSILFLFLSFPVFLLGDLAAQDQIIEQMQTRLEGLRGRDRIDVLLELVELHENDAVDEVQKFGEEALKLLDQHPNRRQEIQVRIRLSRAHSKLGNLEEAISHAKRAKKLASAEGDAALMGIAEYHVALANWYRSKAELAISRASSAINILGPKVDEEWLAKSYSLLGAIYRSQSEYDKALQNHFEALAISTRLNDEKGIARATNNIGIVYWNMDRHEHALPYFRDALEYYRKNSLKSSIATCLNNLGLIHNAQGKPALALSHLEEGLEIYESLPASRGKARILSNLGVTFDLLDDKEASLQFHQRALALREKLGDRHGACRSLAMIAKSLADAGDDQAAIETLKRALEHALTCNARDEQSSIREKLAESYERLGKHEDALRELKLHFEVESEISRVATAIQVAKLEASAELAEKAKKVEALKRERVDQALELSRQRNRQWIMLSLFLLIIGLGPTFFVIWQSRTLRRLNDSKQRYRAAFEDSVAPKFLIDIQANQLIDANGSAGRICGCIPAKLRNLPLEDLRPEWLGSALAAHDGSTGRLVETDCDISGSRRHYELQFNPLELGCRACAVVTLHDTTEKLRLEENRSRIEKLDSLGLLAGGVAHDFKNSLATVMGHVSVARFKTDEDDDINLILKRAELASEQAEQLISQLLIFAKGGSPKPVFQDVEQLLYESVELAISASNANVYLRLAPDLWPLEVDSLRFKQAMSNLLLNAEQSMGEEGRIIVRARNIDSQIAISPFAGPGKYVHIEVQDFGHGIPAELRDKVLDPYFTTKEFGTGLGLATAMAIVVRHNGWMDFDSVEGEGSTFSLYFPCCGESFEEEKSGLTESGSILVMDDDREIQAVFRNYLIGLGYSIETVSDGRAAVSRWFAAKKSGQPFDAVIMDLRVPGGMGGKAAMCELKTQDPNAIGIVTSAYFDDPVLMNFREAGFSAVLEKPFTVSRLARLLDGLVRKRRSL